MRNVLQINIVGKPSGTQNVSVEVAKLNSNYKHIFVFSEDYSQNFVDELRCNGFEVLTCNFLKRKISFFNDLRSLLWLSNLIKTRDIDIIHTHSSKANILGRMLKILMPSLRLVNHIHGLPYTVSTSKFTNFSYYCIELCTSWLADRTIIVNHLYKSHKPYRKALTAYNIFETGVTIFSKDIRAKKSLRVGFVGRFDQQKNPERFLKIAHDLASENVKFQMWGEPLVGGAEIKSSEEVTVHRWVNPSPSGTIELDVLLVLSRWEAFSIVAFEAARSGIIPVGIPVDGFAEIIRTIGVPIEIDSDDAVQKVLIWLSELDLEALNSLKASCRLRASLLSQLNELELGNVYDNL